MGPSNIQKINTMMTLILSKFTIGQQSDIAKGYRNTRVAVITYSDTATILANYTNINSVADFSKVMSNIQTLNSNIANLGDGITKSLIILDNCTGDDCVFTRVRPTAVLLFAASSNIPNITNVLDQIYWMEIDTGGTTITVNFNSGDQA